jgi:hypothetical protein
MQFLLFFSGGRGLNEKAILVVGVFYAISFVKCKKSILVVGGVNIKTILVVVGLCKKSILVVGGIILCKFRWWYP